MYTNKARLFGVAFSTTTQGNSTRLESPGDHHSANDIEYAILVVAI